MFLAVLLFFMHVFNKCFYKDVKKTFFMFFICKLMFLTSMGKTLWYDRRLCAGVNRSKYTQ